jgi:hypothetical protein
MEMYFGIKGIANTIRTLLIASAALLISAPASVGQSEDTTEPKEKKSIAACTDALKADYGVITLSDISHTHKSGHRSVYATAGLASGEAPRFRCIVRHGTEIVRVQVYADGSLSITNSNSGWISAEPYRVKLEPDADVPAETTPEQEPKKSEVPEEISPEFKTPGTGTGFKTPGTGTGFKTPGAGTGSQFKPAK